MYEKQGEIKKRKERDKVISYRFMYVRRVKESMTNSLKRRYYTLQCSTRYAEAFI